jgi:hypothetical protein
VNNFSLRLGAEHGEEDMEIEVSPATPPREWSPSLEDPHTMGESSYLYEISVTYLGYLRWSVEVPM